MSAPSEIRGAADLDIGDVDAGPATGARGITGPAWRDKLDFQTQFDAALETFGFDNGARVWIERKNASGDWVRSAIKKVCYLMQI